MVWISGFVDLGRWWAKVAKNVGIILLNNNNCMRKKNNGSQGGNYYVKDFVDFMFYPVSVT